jgi:transposase
VHSRDTSDWVEGRSKATKPKLQAWLDKKNIPYDPKSSRKELYQKCKDFKPPPLYAADEMFKAASIIPLRTIPYTPEHQPIEYVWSEEKHYVYDRYDGKYETFKTLIPEARASVTPERLLKYHEHCFKLCKEAYEGEVLLPRQRWEVFISIIIIGADTCVGWTYCKFARQHPSLDQP